MCTVYIHTHAHFKWHGTVMAPHSTALTHTHACMHNTHSYILYTVLFKVLFKYKYFVKKLLKVQVRFSEVPKVQVQVLFLKSTLRTKYFGTKLRNIHRSFMTKSSGPKHWRTFFQQD